MSDDGRIYAVAFGLNRFVTTRGGGYFLMPGIAAARTRSTGQL